MLPPCAPQIILREGIEGDRGKRDLRRQRGSPPRTCERWGFPPWADEANSVSCSGQKIKLSFARRRFFGYRKPEVSRGSPPRTCERWGFTSEGWGSPGVKAVASERSWQSLNQSAIIHHSSFIIHHSAFSCHPERSEGSPPASSHAVVWCSPHPPLRGPSSPKGEGRSPHPR